ncbi:uncharacterized protein LOC106076842 [Biomphalaria glabrata]|uniref:Uncharacterized protein LOC106076842 n=2 Tax=Biomphalaria TaxID=6525 RepID=A0A2C9K158_BIOGL|nr:uncharacterized protein LOC106076842 [Biomphalaria glabrata]KAK0066314.1 transmembrane protein 79 [Biomphalaria pfeifferi]
MPRSQPIERQIITKGIYKAAAGVGVAYIALYFAFPIPVPPLPYTIDRLVYTLRLQSFSCLTVIAGIADVSLTRFQTTAIDPINGRGEHHVALSVRYLSNTLEQFVVSFVGQVILATYLTEPQMKNIPILVAFFVAGRLMYYIGYRSSYLQRAPGFAVTAIPSLVVWVCVMLYVISDVLS